MNARHYDPDRLVQLRRDAGMTQEEVAAKIGKKRQNVCRAEKGQPVSYNFLCALARLYGVPIVELLYARPKRAA